MQNKYIRAIIGFLTILLVLTSCEAPAALLLFVESFCVPTLFICIGYIVGEEQNALSYKVVFKAFQFLYPPFVRWSLFFLMITVCWDMLWPDTFVVSGNLSFFLQHIWNILFAISADDIPLCRYFWLFRSLLLGLLAFGVLSHVLKNSFKNLSNARAAGHITVLSLFLLICQIAAGLQITTISGGGYRELVALEFISIGYWLQHSISQRLSSLKVLILFLLLMVCGIFCPGRVTSAETIFQMLSLLVTGISAFLLMLWCMQTWERGRLPMCLLQCVGDKAHYVVAFHETAIFVLCLIAGFQGKQNNLWGLLWLSGTLFPLLWLGGYRWLERRFCFDLRWSHLLNRERGKKIGNFLWRGIKKAGGWMVRLFRSIGRGFWNSLLSFVQGIKDIINASNPKDE